jgi:hypothetical protein
MIRVPRMTVWTVLFLFIFSIVGPVGVAWAQDDVQVSISDSGISVNVGDDSVSIGDTSSITEEDDDFSMPEIISAVIGTVVGGVAGVALGPIGIAGGGALGFFLGKWIGDKLDQKSVSDRASDQWSDTKDHWNSDQIGGKYWWKNKWEGHKDWWKDRRNGLENWWDSDQFAGKYWWKDKYQRAKFWQEDEEDEDPEVVPQAPVSLDLTAAQAAYENAMTAYQTALGGSDQEATDNARASYEAAYRAFLQAKVGLE